ncbi:unnamed protein product, partial [Didymodactylos carnosus]
QKSTTSIDYSDELRARDTIIEELKRSINSTTEHLRNSVLVALPPANIPDDSSRRRVEELQDEVQTHLKTIETLRVECSDLRSSEQKLRLQIDQFVSALRVSVAFDRHGVSKMLCFT